MVLVYSIIKFNVYHHIFMIFWEFLICTECDYNVDTKILFIGVHEITRNQIIEQTESSFVKRMRQKTVISSPRLHNCHSYLHAKGHKKKKLNTEKLDNQTRAIYILCYRGSNKLTFLVFRANFKRKVMLQIVRYIVLKRMKFQISKL